VKKKQRQALQKQSHFSKQKTSIVDQIKKQSPTIAYLPETRLMSKDKHMLMWDDEKELLSKWNPKSSYTHLWQSRLQPKITQEKQRLLPLNKGNNPWEEIKFVNIYILHVGPPNFRKEKVPSIKAQTHPTVIVGDFNTSLSPVDISLIQTKNQQGNLRINWHYRPNELPSRTSEYTFFSVANRTSSKTEHILE
jgi:hypothetical protein